MRSTRSLVVAVTVTMVLSGCAWLTRSSVASAPLRTQATAESRNPSISASGRYVAFDSGDSNLVTGDTNGTADVFVHDNVAQTTERVSVSTAGAQAVGSSFAPSISNDGRYVAFSSDANNLAPDTDTVSDIFVRDRVAQTTQLVSVNDDETSIPNVASQPVISGDGRSVAFRYAVQRPIIDFPPPPPLPLGPFVRDLDLQTTRLPDGVSAQGTLVAGQYDLSDDGSRIVFTEVDIFGFASTVHVADATNGTALVVTGASTIFPDNRNATPVAISGDGAQFAWVINPLVETDPAALNIATTANPSQAVLTAKVVPSTSALALSTDGSKIGARILRSGIHVAAVTAPSLRSIWTVVSASTDGKRPVDTTAIAMSADGGWFGFASNDPILVPDDTNGVADVFTRTSGNTLTPPQ